MPHLIETSSESEFLEVAVDWLQEKIEHVLTQKENCLLGLSGGSTPGPIYAELGKRDLPWDRVSVCLVDERYISGDSDDSNQKLVMDTLVSSAPIPDQNLIFPHTDMPIEECIKHYENHLSPLDVCTLGLGPDGHIASLFPPLSDDAAAESRAVVHTTTDEFAVHDRISLSLPFLQKSGSCVFFLKGRGKKAVWEEMVQSEEGVERWPAKWLLERGNVTVVCWWSDSS